MRFPFSRPEPDHNPDESPRDQHRLPPTAEATTGNGPTPGPGPLQQPVTRWPGWDQPSWQSDWPMGTIPAHPGPTSDYIEQQQMFANGGPRWAGPDANPGGPDLGGDGMPPAGFRIFGSM